MIRTTFSARMAVAASPLTLGLALMATPAHAQATQPADEATTATEVETQNAPVDQASDSASDGTEIVVTGFRGALQSAVNTKKRSDQIVESVSAEDIGKLPDASIAESIARLPGLTSQRLPGPGRSALITVRGFGPDFSNTTLNGRLQTSTNDGRGVEYDQYPSEVVTAVDIYKTQNARLVGQSLAGTVDIRTIRPLNIRNRILAVGVKGIYTDQGKLNPDSNEIGYRVNATYADRFLDNRLGLAFSASYVDEPYQTLEERAWGWPANGSNREIGGLESYNTSIQTKRLGLTGTAQYEVTPELVLTLDSFYSKFEDEQTRRGVEIPLVWGGATLTNAQYVDGVQRSGTFSNVPAVVNNKAFDRKADLYSFGGNLRYEGTSGWNATADIGWSKTDRVELDTQTNAGTGPGALGANDNLDITIGKDGIFVTRNSINYSDPSRIFITDPNGWGGGAPGGRQHGYLNERAVDDEILQITGELEREFESNFIKAARVGTNYVKRTKILTPTEYYLQIAGGALQAQVPQQFLLDPVETWVGLGPMLTYDPRKLVDSGFFSQVQNVSDPVLAKAYDVSEKVTSFYGMVDLEHRFGGGLITGNLGLRAERTDQSSNGFTITPAEGRRPTTRGAKYWDVLPSANISIRLDSDTVFRLAAARQIMRPRFDQMSAEFSYGFDANTGLISGTASNPFLRPFRANAFDATIEQYFGTRGYVSVQGFYKDLKNYVYEDRQQFDFSGFPNPFVPGGPPITNFVGFLRTPINGTGGKIYGAELAGTLPLEVFVGALEGFGLTGGASYSKSKIVPNPDQPASPIPGYSKWVANLTAFYERYGFNIRGSMRYRSKYLGDFTDANGEPNRRLVKPETIIDGQIGYDFQKGSALEGLSLFIQGQNLTDEPFVSYDNQDPSQILNYQLFGRRFMAGATFKFR